MKILYIALIFSILIASCDDLIIKNNSASIVLTTKENTAEKKDTSIPVGTTLTFDKLTVSKLYTDTTYKQELTQKKVPDDKGKITYTSSDEDIATVNNEGIVQFKTAGTVTITASKKNTPQKYQASTAAYKLIITIAEGATLTFAKSTVIRPRREGTYTQEATKTEVTGDTGAITYTSSDDKIATVDENTGAVTFVTAGTVMITATKASRLNMYEKSTARYTLYITMKPTDKAELVKEIQRAMGAHGNNVDLNYIDTSAITNMENLFNAISIGYGLSAFAGDISKWDVSSVTNMGSMFYLAKAFNGDISKWDVSSVTYMGVMFYGTRAFNSDISGWDVSSVTSMYGMFSNATTFNGDISKWDVSSVTSMIGMFHGATAFNQNISGWQVQNVQSMVGMFQGATAFRQNLNDWGSRLHSIKKIKWGFYSIIKREWEWGRTNRMFTRSGLASNLPDWCENTSCKNLQ